MGKRPASPLFAQAARLHRNAKTSETVELITSRQKGAFAPSEWLGANLAHWGIETGLHARLDASRDDERCRLRTRPALWIHGMFNRWANSLFIHWRSTRPNPRHLTTTHFIAAMSENHDQRTLSALTSQRFPS